MNPYYTFVAHSTCFDAGQRPTTCDGNAIPEPGVGYPPLQCSPHTCERESADCVGASADLYPNPTYLMDRALPSHHTGNLTDRQRRWCALEGGGANKKQGCHTHGMVIFLAQ